MKYLMELGIEPNRIRLSQDGIHEPYSKDERLRFRRLNSRVEVFAVSEFSHEHKKALDDRAGDFVDAAHAKPGPHDPPTTPPAPPSHADSHGHSSSGHGSSGHGSSGHAGAASHGGSQGKATPAKTASHGHSAHGHAGGGQGAASHGSGHGKSH
jgi:hypothetical protein